MDRYRLKFLTFLLFFLVIQSLQLRESVSLAEDVGARAQPVLSEVNDINLSSIMQHVNIFLSLGSRVTGYPGHYNSAEYIADVFRSFGLNPIIDEYDVPVPLEEVTEITIIEPGLSKILRGYTMWPNSVQTSPTGSEGLMGRLIDARNGELEDFDGKDVNGSFVLLDFNSGRNWLNAAKLGAKGVVFIEPPFTNFQESLGKFLQTPVFFPRVYVNAEDGFLLRKLIETEEKVYIKVVSKMTYKENRARNVIAVVNGTDYPNDIIIVSAHFDSWSVVPSISPAAEESLSVSCLLELAKYFASHRPRRTIWFVALSGHWQALRGAREFVEKYLFQDPPKNQRIWMQINLDLSTDDQRLELLNIGYGLHFGIDDAAFHARFGWLVQKIYRDYLSPLSETLERETGLKATEYLGDYVRPSMWWGSQSRPYMLDSEPAATAGILAFTLRTSNSLRIYWGTPLNDISFIKLDNLVPQLQVIGAIVYGFANEEKWDIEPAIVSPSKFTLVGHGGFSLGFVTLVGKVAEFNLEMGWYKGVENVIVRVKRIGSLYPFSSLETFSDSNGSFVIHGLPPGFAGVDGYEVEAWKIDDDDGNIEYAIDYGVYGVSRTPITIRPMAPKVSMLIPIVKVVSLTLFDVLNPRLWILPIIPNPRSLEINQNYRTSVARLIPYDFLTQGLMLFYGRSYNSFEDVAVVFVKPGQPFTVTFCPDLYGKWPSAVLINASEIFPEGYGYKILRGGIQIPLTAYHFAKDMYYMTKNRYNKIAERHVRRASAEEHIILAHQYLEKAEAYFSQKLYSKGYYYSMMAWSHINRAYGYETMPLIEDAARTSLFYLFLLLPSIILIEHLILHRTGKWKIFGAFLIGTILFTAFSFLHPATVIINNFAIAILGVVSIILYLLTIGIFTSESLTLLKEKSISILGIHRRETSMASMISIAVSIGIENMRRRRLRTVLTLITMMSIVVALTAFTSFSYFTDIKFVYLPYSASYNGILIKEMDSIPPHCLDTNVISYLKAITLNYNVSIFPRIWCYPPSIFPQGVLTSIRSADSTTTISAMIGITADESKAIFEQNMGRGRWFEDFDYYSCILTEEQSRILKVNINDEVKVMGLTLRVVGIIDGLLLDSHKELDNLMLTPIDPSSSPILSPGIRMERFAERPIPLSSEKSIIIPYNLASILGGYVGSVSIRFDENIKEDDIFHIARELALTTDFSITIGINQAVFQASRVTTFFFHGDWNIIPMIIALGAMNVIMTMLANVKERMRDIYIYSVTGLSPFGILTIFLIEAVTAGIISAALGFILGIGMNLMLIKAQILPPTFLFNSASIFVVISLLSVLVTTLISTSYPARLASRLVTPSYERKWTLVTKPIGNEWSIPIPFVAASKEEAYGILKYLYEYYYKEPVKSGYTIRKLNHISLKEMKMELVVDLIPYEMSISQKVDIHLKEEPDGKFNFILNLLKISGAQQLWITSARYFIDDFRKQMLLWRTLPVKEREKYIRLALTQYRR